MLKLRPEDMLDEGPPRPPKPVSVKLDAAEIAKVVKPTVEAATKGLTSQMQQVITVLKNNKTKTYRFIVTKRDRKGLVEEAILQPVQQ